MLQNLSRLVHHRLLEESTEAEVTCCAARWGLVALGTHQGELLIYQQDFASAACVSVVSSHSGPVSLSYSIPKTANLYCHTCRYLGLQCPASGSLPVGRTAL